MQIGSYTIFVVSRLLLGDQQARKAFASENKTTKISRPVLLHLDRPGGWGVQVGVELLLWGLHRQLHRQHRHHRQLWVSASFLKCNSNVIILWILQFVHKSGWDGSDGWCLHNNWLVFCSQCFRVLWGHIYYSYQLHFDAMNPQHGNRDKENVRDVMTKKRQKFSLGHCSKVAWQCLILKFIFFRYFGASNTFW